MKNSNIEWTDHTFNPWIGCTKVSPGCDNCYAEQRMDKRLHVVNWGPGQTRKRTSVANWREPLKWERNHAAFFAEHGRRQRVFCASLADVFDNEVDPQWRADFFSLIAATPNLDWQLLTKRIGNADWMLDAATDGIDFWGDGGRQMSRDYFSNQPWPHVWIGASIVNQAEADRDIPKLLAVPAAKRFLSMEPLLGPVDLGAWLDPWEECGYCGESFDFERGRPDQCPECGQSGCMGTGFGSELRNVVVADVLAFGAVFGFKLIQAGKLFFLVGGDQQAGSQARLNRGVGGTQQGLLL